MMCWNGCSPQAAAYKISAASNAERRVQSFYTLVVRNKQLQAGMLRIEAMMTVALLLVVAGRGISKTAVEAEPPEARLLCASKCEVCPVVCSQPLPPNASGSGILSPPVKTPPPPTKSSSSYPYYYFYTAGADRVQGYFFGFLLGLISLLVLM